MDREDVELAAGSSVAALVDLIRGRGRDRNGLWESIAIAVNQEYVRKIVVLHDGDEIALLPPVSGGGAGEDCRDAR